MKKFIKKYKKAIIIIGIILVIIAIITIALVKKIPRKHEISTENPTVKEFENYLKDSIKPFGEDTIKDFISSTDNIANVSSNYWGVIYTSEIHDDIKILYSLSRLFYDDSDLINYMTTKGMFDETTGLGEVKLSLNFINKVLDSKFSDTKIKKESIYLDGFFYGINTIICNDNYCNISISTNTLSGSNSDGIYKNSDSEVIKTTSGYELTDEYYYYEFSFSGSMRLGIYNNAFKDKTYCETSIAGLIFSDFTIPESCNQEVKYNKVKYIFDKNYRFVSKENIEEV